MLEGTVCVNVAPGTFHTFHPPLPLDIDHLGVVWSGRFLQPHGEIRDVLCLLQCDEIGSGSVRK